MKNPESFLVGRIISTAAAESRRGGGLTITPEKPSV
jgi:hypothetical protein